MAEQVLSAFGAGVWDAERGEFISDAHRRLAEIVNDYNPALFVAYIPRGETTALPPFAILERKQGREPVVIRYISAEQMQDPKSILTWLFEGDLIRHGMKNVLARVEIAEMAERALQLKQWEDEAVQREEQIAFFASGGRNKLHTIRHNGKKTER